jgi:hypothetical protein
MTDTRVAYTRRECEGCGRGMQPYHPRKPVGGRALCPMCATNERFRVGSMQKTVIVAVRTAQGRLGLTGVSPAQGIAHFIAADKPDMVKLAHDSGDSVTVFHCPFCGSGQVLARSDGNIECEFCHSSFTVQIQPEFSAFPQTINGMPVDVPGMGPDQAEGAPPMLDGQSPEEGGFPPSTDGAGEEGEEEDPEAEEEDEGEEDEGNPFAKKSRLRTEDGHELELPDYLKYLALSTTGDREALLARVRADDERNRR